MSADKIKEIKLHLAELERFSNGTTEQQHIYNLFIDTKVLEQIEAQLRSMSLEMWEEEYIKGPAA